LESKLWQSVAAFARRELAHLHGELVNDDWESELIVKSLNFVDKIVDRGGVHVHREVVGLALLGDQGEEFLASASDSLE